MSVLAATARAQAAANLIMVDTCIARRPTGTQTVNQSTGAVSETFTDLFTDKCRLRGVRRPRDTAVGESEVTVDQVTLTVPAARDDLRVGDVVEILTSQSPGMVGRKVRVSAPWLQTSSSSCRYWVQESTIPDMPSS